MKAIRGHALKRESARKGEIMGAVRILDKPPEVCPDCHERPARFGSKV